TIPAYRNDVTRDVDVIEEILRVYGYNNIKVTEKLNASISKTAAVEDHKVQDAVATLLNSNGFHEMMANSLTNPKYHEYSTDIQKVHDVNIINPLSRELSVMRQSLLFSALEAVSYNINRKRNNLKLFEFGKTYHNIENNKIENKH